MTKDYRFFFGFMVVALVLTSTAVLAEDRPIQLSLVTPIQIFSEDDSIKGFRLNLLYGRNASIKGVDLGLVNHTTSGISKGWQLGLVGVVDSDFVGWQDNSVNVVKGNFSGFQWGAVNYAKSAKGFQLGMVNYAERMNGLQIGFVNIIRHGGMLPVFPIINWSF
jgi:hypothetical protein